MFLDVNRWEQPIELEDAGYEGFADTVHARVDELGGIGFGTKR